MSVVTTSQGLNPNTSQIRLFEKATHLSTWNPSDLNFLKDIKEWDGFSNQEQTVSIYMTSLFQSGDEAVSVDILPIISVVQKMVCCYAWRALGYIIVK